MRLPRPGRDGYLNVLKPPGVTSHDVVARVRRIAQQRRVGHAGTLDPAAVGVLPVALGRATRTVSSPLWDRKLYWADVRFGASTDTDDAEGRALSTGDWRAIHREAAVAALGVFVGDIEQSPPAYSAVHVAGQRAYTRARAGSLGPLPTRRARVDAIRGVAWRPPVLSLVIQCGPGTYVRSIARDLGVALGCPAHLAGLVRLRVGPFRIEDAIDERDLQVVGEADAWERVLWAADVAATHLDAVLASPEQVEDFAHGRSWQSVTDVGPAVRVYAATGELVGFARPETGRWRPLRGLPTQNPSPLPLERPARARSGGTGEGAPE